MFINYLKKAVIYLFTRHPYRVGYFRDIYQVAAGKPVDQPESLSGILLCQEGEIMTFPFLAATAAESKIHQRHIGNRPRFKEAGLFRAPDRYIYSIENAGILGQLGLVYDPEMRVFIDESAKEWVVETKDSPFLNALKRSSPTTLKGITFSFLTIGADAGFYHFLFESLVKTAMYGELLASADQMLFNGPVTPWKLKWITKANIDVSKIIWTDNNAHFNCEQLIFTNRLVADQQINKWCISALLGIFGIVRPQTSRPVEKKILWISRKGLSNREILWEEELLASFPNMERIDFSGLSVEDTIEKMRNATYIAGPHGAGLSNIYLCRPGTKILEIYPREGLFQPCYQRLSQINGLEHSSAYIDFKDKMNPTSGLDSLVETIRRWIC